MPFDTLHEPFEVLDPGALPTMEKFIIEGGQPLSGTIVPAGNKNAALPALAATLLTEEQVMLHNIPRIRDVEAMIELLRALGATVEWREAGVVAVCAAGVDHTELDGSSQRASALRSCSPGHCWRGSGPPPCRRRAAT